MIMWPLFLLSCVQASLAASSLVGYIGTPTECAKAHFVPGYNLGGEGFDVVTMERKGAFVIDTETWKTAANGSCQLYRNRYMNQEVQKVPVSVVDWRILPQCSLKVDSRLYDSAEALVNDSASSVSNNWKVGLEIPLPAGASVGVGLGGSHSRESTFGMQKSKQDRYSFSRQSIQCKVYRYRMSKKPQLNAEFLSQINALPQYSHGSAQQYRALIDTYGTHYITRVALGGSIKAVTSIKTCEAAINGLSTTEVSDCLSVEASASFAASVRIKAMTEHCEAQKKKLGHSQNYRSMFNERHTEVTGGSIDGTDVLFEGQSNPSVYDNWLKSLKTLPDVVQYDLHPLHMVLPAPHPAAAGLKAEVEQYIKNNAIATKCSERCQIGHRSNKRDPCACVCNSSSHIKSNCCPNGKGLATLKVFSLYAQNLYGDTWSKTDGSVEVTYGKMVKRTNIISSNDNPVWGETFEFGPITMSMANKLRFRVYDEDQYWNSDLLGECSFELHSGKESNSCMLNHGTFFFSYTAECAPSLGGNRCQEYIPASMSPSLKEVFYTRNGVLLGEQDNRPKRKLQHL
ncbi:perforin-1-like [Takifugu flavidus]|uniref:Perforin-1 n=1 Tax=Takifugu flavidus TaxID=433684 RepID=A0A5C6N272_9TELE|nr:perforin-1-like [Takifugu flavidus]TWW59757.1 Perforin-1 [Takifugu flavidus]